MKLRILGNILVIMEYAIDFGTSNTVVARINENGEIATYFLDMECANCGSLATAPTPIDINGMDQ